jgi:hypothetical protein
MPSRVVLSASVRGTLWALRQGAVGISTPYCQLFIHPTQMRRPSDVGTSDQETAA